MKTRNMAVPASYLILEKDGKVLIARRCNTGYQDGNYQVPAGHVDAGELPSEALIREAKEEIGIDIDPKDIKLVHMSYRTKHNPSGDRVDFFFRVRKWRGEVTNMEPEKCDDLRWVLPSEIPENFNPPVREAIQLASKGIFLSEFDVEYFKKHELYQL